MVKRKIFKGVFVLFILLQNLALFGQRISVSGTEFRTDNGRIWLNGSNTPWNEWNDFGGSFDYDWWEGEFAKLSDLHINCTRIWITCDGNNKGIDIGNDGYVNGVSALFWSHVDQLMEIAETYEVYVMIALISFDHTKPGNPNASKWVNMYNSEDNRQSFADNYAEPFVDRYKDNPYFFAIDVGNELDWVWENHGVSSSNVIDLISRVADVVKEGSDVLVCQGLGAGIKYNTSARGGSGNYLADVNVDFYNVHYYDWQNQWFGNPFDRSPTYYNMNEKPCIIGEAPANGSAGYSPQECYQKAFEQGWQGLMVWTSNGVDGNGDKEDSKPGTDWIYDNYPDLVEGIDTAIENNINLDFKLCQNYPNPFNPSTKIKFDVKSPCEVNLAVYNVNGQIVRKLVDSYQHPGAYSISLDMQNNPSGIYVYKMSMGNFQEIKKMVKIE